MMRIRDQALTDENQKGVSKMTNGKYDVVVMGSGMGGLCA